MALDVHVFVVINKIDLCTEDELENTINKIESLLKSAPCGKTPVLVNTDEDMFLAAQRFSDPSVCPIFKISCMQGTNLEKLNKFLNLLPPLLNIKKNENELNGHTLFRVCYLCLKLYNNYAQLDFLKVMRHTIRILG
jgi:GTPase